MTMELTDNQQMELVEKFKETLICPKCQENLVHKDYLINKKDLRSFLQGVGVAILIFIICTIL